MSGLMEGSWILITAFMFSLLKYVLFEGDEANLVSHGNVVESERVILFGFAGNCEYSLIRHQNLTSGRLILKVSWRVESETLSAGRSCFVTLKSTLHFASDLSL